MKSILNYLQKKLKISSNRLIILLTFYFGFVLNMSLWQFLFNNITITNSSVLWFVITIPFFVLLPLFIIFNLFVTPYIAKPVVSLLLLASASANYMMVHYGIFIDKHMIQNVLETNTREATDLFTFSFITWLFITGVVPAIILMFTKIKYSSFKKEILRKTIFIVLSFGLFFGLVISAYKEYSSFGRNNREVKYLMNVENYILGSISYYNKLRVKDREFSILDKNAKHEPLEKVHTVLVFVLGETARASNFSLNGYARQTNPLLEKEDIVYFKETTSCGTATAISVPCMFSHMLRSNFDSTEAKYTENLIDILQKSGYDIIWKDNDDGCKGVCDRVEKTENMVDTQNPKYCKTDYCYDDILLNGLDDTLKNIKKDTVIVLHTMGSHGPTYYRRYPDEFKKFQPTCDTADIENCTLPQIINTYDNTILYTDHIVSSIINKIKKRPNLEAGVLYVSDHGESLGENNVYLHGMPYKIAPREQTNVPMVLWMNKNMQKYDYIDYSCMKENASTKTYSHDNIFHSILGLLEIESKVYNVDYDIFKPCRTKDFK